MAAFTLIELLIAMSLTILVGGVLYLLQSTGLRSVTRGTTTLAMHSEVRRRLEIIVDDLLYAQEVLALTSDSIKVLRFRDGDDDGVYGDRALVVVEYKLTREDKQSVLTRAEAGEPPRKIIEADHIEADLFDAYYESGNINEPETSFLELFDKSVNDSEHRRRICFVRIRLNLRQHREFFSVTTGVTLRAARSRLSQPNWNLR